MPDQRARTPRIVALHAGHGYPRNSVGVIDAHSIQREQ